MFDKFNFVLGIVVLNLLVVWKIFNVYKIYIISNVSYNIFETHHQTNV